MATALFTQSALNHLIQETSLKDLSPLSISNHESETKNFIRNKEYNILMNTPELEEKTLTLELNSNINKSLLRIRKVSHSTKISIKSAALNTKIQKLRIIYFLVFTQNYESMWDCSITDIENQEEFYTKQLKWKNAYDQIRLACYEDSVDPLDMKYLAEFFQFLDYDLEHKVENSKNLVQTNEESQEETCRSKFYEKNMVICELNKYPIIDELLTKMFMNMINVMCEPVSLDDNYNMSKLVKNKLKLDIHFISNWEFILMGIKVEIGKDVFAIDNNLNNYFNAITNSLEMENQQHSLFPQYGLDVSCVAIPDSNTFAKMDQSFIENLFEFLENEPIESISDDLSANPDNPNDTINVAKEIYIRQIPEEIFEEKLNLENKVNEEQNVEIEQPQVKDCFSENVKVDHANEDIEGMLNRSENDELLLKEALKEILMEVKEEQKLESNLIKELQNETQSSTPESIDPPKEEENQTLTHSQHHNPDLITHSQNSDPFSVEKSHHSKSNIKEETLENHESTLTETVHQSSISPNNEYPSHTIEKSEIELIKGSVILAACSRDIKHNILVENEKNRESELVKETINPEINDKSFHQVRKDIEKILSNINECILKSSFENEPKQSNTIHKLNNSKGPVFLKDKIEQKGSNLEIGQFMIPDLIKRKSKEPNLPNFLAKRSHKNVREEQKFDTSSFRKVGTHQLHPQLLKENQLSEQQPILITPSKIYTEASFKPHIVSFELLHPKVHVKNNMIHQIERPRSSFKTKRQGITITQSKPALELSKY